MQDLGGRRFSSLETFQAIYTYFQLGHGLDAPELRRAALAFHIKRPNGLKETRISSDG